MGWLIIFLPFSIWISWKAVNIILKIYEEVMQNAKEDFYNEVDFPESEDWPGWIEFIEDMEKMDDYKFAHKTLEGIRVNLEEYENATEGQIRAIKNIFNSKQ